MSSLGALEGFVIGVTADRRWTEQAELLQRRGAVVLHGPTIKTEYLASDEALRSATHTVIARRPDYLVATTGIGVRAWVEAAQVWGLADSLVEALADTRIAARGPKAAGAVQATGLAVWHKAESERLDELVDALCRRQLAGKTVAFQHYGERNAAAVDELVVRGAEVIEVPIYRWQRPDDDGPARRLVEAAVDGRLDAVTFTSAPALHNLMAVARDHGMADALLDAFNSRVVAACIGPVCAEGARQAGVENPVAPNHGRLGLLVRALTDVLQRRRCELAIGDAAVVVQGRIMTIDGVRIELPDRERAVLDALLAKLGAVVSKPAILRSLGDEGGSAHALEATVARLRRRLGPVGHAIRSVRGRGYVLDAQPARPG